jgi:hypothetical protein
VFEPWGGYGLVKGGGEIGGLPTRICVATQGWKGTCVEEF